ncbi:hypothetical protein LR48_Vigan08g069300 [Vigna angularis]|uniref:Uncharacterized protein n=1 Tax=Phaseolus angularis TaxID=3914 RepID=A0A0L9V4E0_PHAAN|nr:hypothetical protein LR48_Vigan08g069300 [Vigna angularis]
MRNEPLLKCFIKLGMLGAMFFASREDQDHGLLMKDSLSQWIVERVKTIQLPFKLISPDPNCEKKFHSEFGERSEEGERWNQKRHQKVQKEKPQLPVNSSLPLSGTQELTGDPVRGKMVIEGKKPTHALTVEGKKICVKIKKLKRKRKEKKKIREKKKRKFRERKRKKKRMRGKKKKSYEKSHPHPKKYHRKKEFERLMEIFKKLEIKVPMIETLQQALLCTNTPTYLFQGMTSSSGKRLKTMATKRKEKEPEQPHSSRFLSRKHEKHFKVVQDRRLLMERKVGMIPTFAPQFGEKLLGNDWGKLATYPAPANIAVVATVEMIVGMYDTPPAHRWTMEEFHNVVAWPEEQVQGEGAEAAEASVREMEEDEAEFSC